MQKVISEYLSKRENAIQDILSQQNRSFKVETFHKLRVEIKKLNALLTLTEACIKGFDKSVLFLPIRELFKQAGKIREIHIENRLFNIDYQEGSLKEYHKNQNKKLKKERLIFFNLLENEILDALKHLVDTTEIKVKTIENREVDTFLQNKKKKIKNIFKLKKIPKSKLHKLRKELKFFNYYKKMLGRKELQFPIKKNIDLSDLLGKWHDLEVSIENLNKAKKEGFYNFIELAQMKQTLLKLQHDNDGLLKKIRKSIKTFNCNFQ